MERYGLFLSDASFDYKTKTASIGIFNIVNKKEYSFITKANNPTDAEIFGMRKIIEIATEEKIIDVSIISDSKNGISFMKKEIYNKQQLQKEKDIKNDFVRKQEEFVIRFIQFLWVPRELNQIADMLSKNIHETDIESFKEIKEDNIKLRKENIDKQISKTYVKDVSYQKNFENDKLSIRCKEFTMLCNFNDIKIEEFKSKICYLLKSENYNIELFEELILDSEEIELFEKDISMLSEKNILLKISLEIIRDLLIFN